VVTDSETKPAKYENNIETSISSLYSQKISYCYNSSLYDKISDNSMSVNPITASLNMTRVNFISLT